MAGFFVLQSVLRFCILNLSNRNGDYHMNTDLLVKLYDLPDSASLISRLKEDGITIHRAMPLNRDRILAFIADHFSPIWVNECSVALSSQPTTCYIAVQNNAVIGFACFDATAKGFFGPTGVLESMRGKDIGTALLLKTLEGMRETGYGYAVIGWVSDALGFYQKTVNAQIIPDSFPGVYRHMIEQN